MKITIEFDNEQDAMIALSANSWYNAMWHLDQELRGIVKHGYIGSREATDCELEAYSNCRDMIRTIMGNNNLSFDI